MTTELKAKLIEAHRSQDWDTAAVLSQEREKEKREMRKNKYCIVCGSRINNGTVSGKCRTHFNLFRNYGHALALSVMLMFIGCATQTGKPPPTQPPPPLILNVIPMWSTNPTNGWQQVPGWNTISLTNPVNMNFIYEIKK